MCKDTTPHSSSKGVLVNRTRRSRLWLRLLVPLILMVIRKGWELVTSVGVVVASAIGGFLVEID